VQPGGINFKILVSLTNKWPNLLWEPLLSNNNIFGEFSSKFINGNKEFYKNFLNVLSDCHAFLWVNR